ncbi:MAG TPA: Fur family transcriptional regulator, partial [Acidimicrobiales bacterium]
PASTRSLPSPAIEAHPDPRLQPIVDKIRSSGGKVTRARMAILEGLLAGPHHATVEELEARVRMVAPDVHEATFYRTLGALEELGVVYHLHFQHGPSIWHVAGEDHEHLFCQACGCTIEVASRDLEPLRAAMARRYGFVLDTRHFVHQGLCRACAARPDTNRGS